MKKNSRKDGTAKAAPAVKFRNRIAGNAEVDPRTLTANPNNWRRHPQGQRDALAGVLTDVGWVDQVIVNKTTGLLIDGHARVELAVQNGEPTVPVLYVTLTEQEEALILATFDPITAMAEADKSTLDGLLSQITTDNVALTDMLKRLANQGVTEVTFLAREVIRSDERELLLVECKTERDLQDLFNEMKGRGYECKIMS